MTTSIFRGFTAALVGLVLEASAIAQGLPTLPPNTVAGRFATNAGQADYNVANYGAKGDGVTDDTAAVQAALNAVPAAGGAVYFPPGTYKVTAGLTISAPVTLLGAGTGSVIAPNFAAGDVLTITSNAGDVGFGVAALEFKASVTRTANYYINIANSNYGVIREVTFVGGYSGIGLTGTADTGIHMRDVRFQSLTHNGIDVTATAVIDLLISGALLAGASSGAQMANGINITSGGDVTLDHVSTVYAGTGLNVVPGNGQTVQALFVNNSFFDTGSGSGINLSPSGTGVVQLFKAENTWSASNTVGGIIIAGGSGWVEQADLINCTVSGNTSLGILINTNATSTSVIGGSVGGNGSHGILVAANVTKFKIIGVNIGASGQFSGNRAYGIAVASGSSDLYDISHNYFSGNTSGAISDLGTGTNKIIGPNFGSGTGVR